VGRQLQSQGKGEHQRECAASKRKQDVAVHDGMALALSRLWSRRRVDRLELKLGENMRAASFIDRAERWPTPIVVLITACLLMTAAAVFV
jgi:hypothetical protein